MRWHGGKTLNVQLWNLRLTFKAFTVALEFPSANEPSLRYNHPISMVRQNSSSRTAAASQLALNTTSTSTSTSVPAVSQPIDFAGDSASGISPPIASSTIISPGPPAPPAVAPMAGPPPRPEFDWMKVGNKFYPMLYPDQPDLDPANREVAEFSAEGRIVRAYLTAGAFSHDIIISVGAPAVARIKEVVRTCPEFRIAGYRFPFPPPSNETAKFISKDELHEAFKSVWDARGMADLMDVQERVPIDSSRIERGKKVFVEYTIIPYAGKESDGSEQGFSGGCTLKLLSIGLLDDSVARGGQFQSPLKPKRRMGFGA